MATLTEIMAAHDMWRQRYNQELNEAIQTRKMIYDLMVLHLRCKPDQITLGELNIEDYGDYADELSFYENDKLIRDTKGFWYAPLC